MNIEATSPQSSFPYPSLTCYLFSSPPSAVLKQQLSTNSFLIIFLVFCPCYFPLYHLVPSPSPCSLRALLSEGQQRLECSVVARRQNRLSVMGRQG